MAVSAWPGTLPQVLLVDGYSEGMGDGRLRTQTDTGPAKVRRRSSAMSKPLQGRMYMTTTQLAALETFVEDTLIGGTLPFTLPHPVTGTSTLVRFAGALPSWSNVAPALWDVSLDMEIVP